MMKILTTLMLVKTILNDCDPGTAALYNITLQTYWTTDNFPKQYPTWRPPAQWSAVYGFSHESKDHPLFGIGNVASDGVAMFVETGDTSTLLSNVDMSSVLDMVTAPAILSGAGVTQTTVFVDGRNSKISLMSKLVPSPDWFIGVDSLDLCQDNRLADSISEHLEPLDGGTDNGFTYTSPNWPTEPRGVVFQISNTYPTHPAGSFNYPHLKRLPHIATIHFKKVKEYKEVSSKQTARESKKMKYFVDEASENDVEINFVPFNDDKEKILSFSKSKEAKIKKKGTKKKNKKNLAAFRSNTISQLDVFPTSDDGIFMNKDGGKPIRRRKRKLRGRRRHKKNKASSSKSVSNECAVSQWSEWSSCSMSCGIGERVRQRKVTQEPSKGGQVCPPLKEKSWCGSARDCHPGYFDW